MTSVLDINRRVLLGGLGSALGAGLMQARAPAAWAAACPNACRSIIDKDDGWIHGLPIIDAHCHIFNARDIPALQFITKVFLPHYAPDLSAKNRKKLEAEIAEYASGILGRTPGFDQEFAVLEARLAGAGEPESLAGKIAFPKFARGDRNSCFGADLADRIVAMRNLVTILTGFRHKNFEALMATNATSIPGVGVSMYTPSMIDMDYWLGFGGEAESSIGDAGTDAYSLRQTSPARQAVLMEMIQRLYPGRCHGFVSFCPWRQVDDSYHNALVGEDAPRRRMSALEVVEDAVLNRGVVGVKIYPPMGFRPLGNAELPVEAFPPAAAGADYADQFGLHLDEALLALYRFCAANDVPIMAHTAPSNGAGFSAGADGKRTGYEMRAHPEGWARVLAQPGLSGLKVNLAHFGGSPHKAVTSEWRAAIGALMDAYPNVYTDLSHYPELLMDNFTGTGQHCREAAELLEPLRKEFLAGETGAKRVRRILYGSDWSMLSKEFYYADYLPVVAHLYRRKIYGMGQGAEQNAMAFLSASAAAFLGLRPGDKARERLEAWYAKHGLEAASLARYDAVGE